MPLFTLAEIMVLTTCKDLFDAIKLVNDKICQCDFILDSDNIIVKKESRDLNKMIFFVIVLNFGYCPKFCETHL